MKTNLTSCDGASRCTTCSSMMEPVEYYLARPVRQETQSTATTATTTIVYTDVSRNIGHICLHCGLKRDKKKQSSGFILLAAGGIVLLASIVLIASGSSAGTLSVLLLIAGIAALIAGIAFAVPRGFCVVAKFAANEQQHKKGYLENLFRDYASKEHPKSGFVYLTPDLAKKLAKI